MTITGMVRDETKQGEVDLFQALREFHSDSEIFALFPALEKIVESSIDFLIVDNGKGGYAIFPDPSYGASPVMTYSPGHITTWNEGFDPTVPGFASVDTLPTYAAVAENIDKLKNVLSNLGMEVKTHSLLLTFDNYKEEVA